MQNSPSNNFTGGTHLPPNVVQSQFANQANTQPVTQPVTQTDTLPAPNISYNIVCNNQPEKESLAEISSQPQQPEQPVLAEMPFQVNTEVVHSEDELFQIIYNRMVSKLEADRDAGSARNHK